MGETDDDGGVRPRLLIPFVAALLATLLVPSIAAAAGMGVVDPITDNYKASYNDDPDVQETRTLLATKGIVVDGATWTPHRGSDIIVTGGASVTVTSDDGRSGTLQASVLAGAVASLAIRIDPLDAESGGRWGPLITLADPDALATNPISLQLALVVDDATLGSGTVSYRYDEALATAPESSVEHNGPGGRWWVGSTRLRTDWETSTASTVVSADVATAPRIAVLRLPVATSRPNVRMVVRWRTGGSRVTMIRTAVGGAGFGAWRPVRSSYIVRLPHVNRSVRVRVQIRDASGRASRVASRVVRCTCG